jgi:cytochrome c oxidase cbb3-type subunit III
MTQQITLPITAAVDDDDEPVEAELLDHAYDGIREYDNPLPGWWRSIFIATIVFAGFYALYFHVVGWGHSPDENYKQALSQYQVMAAAHASGGPSASEEVLATGSHDDGIVSRGHGVFVSKCAGCHGDDAHGIIGPNLTDDFQLHGHTREDIFETIRDGVPTTPMPAWGSQMSGEDVIAVAVYVTTLRGTNVPGGKAPQGNKVGAFKAH